MQRVIVAGAAGFIGAALANTLLDRGADVVGVAHPRTDAWRVDDRVALRRIDLATEPEALAALMAETQPDVVFNTIVSGMHPATPEERARAWSETMQATLHLGEALAATPPRRLVHVGSSLEYRSSDRPMTEDDPIQPSTVRGAIKAASGIALRQQAQQAGVPVTIVRPFSVYGPKEPPARLVPTVLRAATTGEPVSLTRHDTRRDFVHVDDVVDLCLLAAVHPAAAGEAFNAGTGVETTTSDVVETVGRVTGRRIEVSDRDFAFRPPDRDHWVADVSKAARLLGWRARTTLAEGLASTYQGMQRATVVGRP